MNKVSVDLDMNVQGYVQGIDKATKSTADYETETKKVSESQINLMKELKKAKKDVQNLAAGFAKLDKEAKKSAFGQEMARQLNIAKEKAAEYIDMQADLNQELKNMASDTRTLDVLSDAMGVVANSVSTAAGAVATFTGNEEDAKRAVTAFTTATSALATVTKLQNALQKQSSLMLGVQKVQMLAASAATKAQTSSLAGATVAQKAFNAVAKANPYLLLAGAIAAVVAAVVAYVNITKKATKEQLSLEKAIHESSLQGRKDAQADIIKLDNIYAATQNTNASMNERLRAIKDLRNQYPGYFKDMTDEQILLGEASAKYQQLKNDIIACATARAYEKRMTELAEKKIDLEDEIKARKKNVDLLEKQAKDAEEYARNNYSAQGVAGYNSALDNATKKTKEYNDANKELRETAKEWIDVDNQMKGIADKLSKTNTATQRFADNTDKANSSTKSHTSSLKKQQDQAKAVEGSMADLEKQISTLQDQAKKGILPNGFDSPEQYQKELDRLTSRLKELRIKWGFEKPQTQMQKLQAKFDAAKEALILAIDAKDEQAIKEAQKVYKEAQDELDKHKLKIEVALDQDRINRTKEEVRAIVKDALTPRKKDEGYDFSYLPKKYEEMGDDILEAINRIGVAKAKLEEKLSPENSKNLTGEEFLAYKTALIEVGDAFNSVENQAKGLQNINDKFKKILGVVGLVNMELEAAGQMFSALGDAAQDTDLKVAGVVAQAIAQLTLSFAKAMKTCSTWYEWLAFGMTGVAQLASMISQIRSITAGSYADGGIVPGNSYSGDRLTANVNSGEMILNKKQQQNLFNMLDTGTMPQKGGTNVTVTGVIRGTDLMLVQRNTAKVMKKAGNSINF